MLSRRVLRIKVLKALYAHFKGESASAAASQKLLLDSLDKAWELYLHLLCLPVALGQLAEERVAIARAKKLPTAEDLNPNLKFIENAPIAQIAQSAALADHFTKRRPPLWARYPELVKGLLEELAASDFYRSYMAEPERSYKADQRLLMRFFEQIVAQSDAVAEAVEEQSVLWADDLDFGVVSVVHTLGEMREGGLLPISPQYKGEQDKRFAKDLLRGAIKGFDEYRGYIELFVHNWDVERITFMDTLIMVMAVAEMVGFEDIPLRVTIDEYLELSKFYSTPASALFINGILDKIVEKLQADGRLTK